jgi:hypothetical protein
MLMKLTPWMCAYVATISGTYSSKGQFHQPIVRKHKCARAISLAQSVSPTKLYSTLRGNITRSYAQLLCFMPYSNKIRVNLPVKKLLIKQWWNWSQVSISLNAKRILTVHGIGQKYAIKFHLRAKCCSQFAICQTKLLIMLADKSCTAILMNWPQCQFSFAKNYKHKL